MLLNKIFMYNTNYYEVPYLAHHGILGMKWGIRRYQNRDGSLTKKGKRHRQEALNQTADSKKYFKDDMNKSLKNLNSIRYRKHGKMSIDNDAEKTAEDYIRRYKMYKTQDLLEKAYKNGDLSVGKDYIAKRGKNIIFTDSGNAKLKSIETKADAITRKNNSKIIDRYINGPKQKREKVEKARDLGNKYADEIMLSVNEKHYKTVEQKINAIDKAFKAKCDEADKSGDTTLSDELWQRWNAEIDNIYH